jgi:H+/Cl- antiporter ClcA/CBS domain-containing protein
MWLLSAVAVVLGLVGGAAAVGLFKLIGLITHLALLHDVGTSLPSLRDYHPSLWIVPTALVGAVIVSLFAVWAPVIRGHGIPESLEAILTRDSKIRPRAAMAKPLSAAVTIGTGGPFGAEGPIIVTGGSIGSLIGQVLSVSPAERRIMLATGAAAGMSATFNAPVASVILAIELVLFERSLRTIVPLSIACSIAASIHILAFGADPLFALDSSLHVGLSHLPLFAVVGVAAGIMAVVLNKGLFAMEAAFRKLPVNIFWWPVIGALCFSLIGLLEPRTLSMGYSAISDTLNGRFTFAALAGLFVAKLISWWISLGSQTSGGTLAPMFLVGATMGALLGHAVNDLFPALHVSPGAFALVAMAATFGAATKALLASAVFSIEVTGEYHMIIAILIGIAFAELVVELFLTDRLMTEKLSHRGFRVDFRTETRVTRMRLVGQVMHEPWFVPADTPVAQARQLLAEHVLTLAAVARTDGYCLGLITAAALDQAADDTAVASLARTAIAPLSAREYLASALDKFSVSGALVLPVVEKGRVVGQLSRADIDAERDSYYSVVEARQPGWASALRARRRGPRPLVAAPRTARAATEHGHLPVLDDAGSVPQRTFGREAVNGVDHEVRLDRREPKRETSTGQLRGQAHAATTHTAPIQIVPKPVRVEPHAGQFTLGESSRIVVGWNSAAALPVAEALAAALRPATGYRLAVTRGRALANDIAVNLEAPAADMPDGYRSEGYQIEAGSSGTSLTAATVHGLYNGVQTIRQLLPVWIASRRERACRWLIPGVRILDYPRFGYRGVMLDMSRRVVSPAGAMRVIDESSAYKINSLHVRFSIPQAYRLASDGVPGLAAVAADCPHGYLDPPEGSWSERQYTRIVKHAARRHLTVVPEVQLPDGDDIAVWILSTAILSRLATLSPGSYYNLGGSSVPPVPHAGSRSAQFITAQSGMVNALGKTVMVQPGLGTPGTHLAPDSVIEYHGAASGAAEAGSDAEVAVTAAAAGMRLIMSPTAHTDFGESGSAAEGDVTADARVPWAGAPDRDVDQFYSWDPADYLDGVSDVCILGVEAALRGQAADAVRDAERLIFPRLLATAEIGWSPRVDRGAASPALPDFLSRVAAQGTRLSLAGTRYSPSPLVPWRAELSAAIPSVQGMEVTGAVAELIAPVSGAEPVAAVVDWGDGTRTSATTACADRDRGTGGRAFTITASHSYQQPGSYYVTVSAALADATALRTALTVRVRRIPRRRLSEPTALPHRDIGVRPELERPVQTH